MDSECAKIGSPLTPRRSITVRVGVFGIYVHTSKPRRQLRFEQTQGGNNARIPTQDSKEVLTICDGHAG